MDENKAEIPVTETPKIKVYVKLDTNKIVKEVGSSNFIQDLEGWIEIDEGYGDKYFQAQNNYFEKGLVDEKVRYNYKWDTKLVELTEEEKDILFPPVELQPTEYEVLRSEIDFGRMVRETQQSEIDYLKLMGGM